MAATTIRCMGAIRVVGGHRLQGEVRVSGAKNSVLKLMAASLLAHGTSTLHNVPEIDDVSIMAELLRRLGCDVVHDLDAASLTISVPEHLETRADYDLVRRMRASICVLGPLITRIGKADVALPGGDAIGSRGLDMHIDGLTRMGADVTSEHGYVVATAARLHGAEVFFDFPSVGATENILMAAVLAQGTTVIDNAAREPEIVDLANMLRAMGAQVSGDGSSVITVEGVGELHPVQHTTVSDRIVAGTWAIAAVMTQGDVHVRNADAAHLELALEKLTIAGAHIDADGDGFRVRMDRRPRAIDIVTLPYPGIATDFQPQFIALNAIADGAAMVTENLFEARFRFAQELARLGADVRTDGHHALVRGHAQLSGAPVEATDIRAGAALVLAGLCADGITTVHGAEHVDRGYAGFVGQLRDLGADAVRLP